MRWPPGAGNQTLSGAIIATIVGVVILIVLMGGAAVPRPVLAWGDPGGWILCIRLLSMSRTNQTK
ncbi:MAG: hypothetical protein LBU24_05255 [Methanocalculaceae archaeon]|nr:hypothetical protein [Methanocalculaceae archaeon]